MKTDSQQPRAYRQSARAKTAEETGTRILEAFIRAVQEGWFEEVRLEDIANEAEVTVQTVIRRFGGKEGLLEAATAKLEVDIFDQRGRPVGDIPAALSAIIREYETMGDLVLRMLAQEDRYPAIRKVTEQGRRDHRAWVGEVFAPWLDALEATARQDAHDRLVIALDVYVWKLMRIDMKRSTKTWRETMLAMVAGALKLTPAIIESSAAVPAEN